MKMIHELKTWPQFFERIASNEKKFEVRKNGRDFQAGDTLRLIEFDPSTNRSTKRVIQARIDYVLCGPGFGIEDGYCVMSLGGITLKY